MAISHEQLSKILSKSSALCSPEGDRLVESYKTGSSDDPDPNSYDDYNEFDALYSSEYDPNMQQGQQRALRYNEEMVRNSNLPDKVKQSMINEVIEADPLGKLDVKPQRRKQQRQINEQTYQQPSVNGVDYSIIKAIVNECLNDYFSRQPLNESASISTIGLKAGAIKIVDNKGNVYSAKLEKIGNTNKN